MDLTIIFSGRTVYCHRLENAFAVLLKVCTEIMITLHAVY